MGKVAELNEADFDRDVLQASQPVLVDFWAPWCGPCRQIAPLIEELAAENEGSAHVMKLNVDENPGIAQQYGVMSIPTLIVFRGGQVVEKFIGAKSKAVLQEALDAAKA